MMAQPTPHTFSGSTESRLPMRTGRDFFGRAALGGATGPSRTGGKVWDGGVIRVLK